LTISLLVAKAGVSLFSAAAPLAHVIYWSLATLYRDPTAKITFAMLAHKAALGELVFCRQVALFGYFMLGLLPEGTIDWDDVLAPPALARLFGLSHEPGGGWTPLRTIPLPDEWVSLLLPPYNFDIVSMDRQTGVCLLTGQRITFSQVWPNEDFVNVMDHMRGTLKNGPMLMLYLTGPRLSQVVIRSLELNMNIANTDVWLDEIEMPDIGLEQGRLLRLNKTRLAKVLDDYMSGKFHDFA
jgi:hypothetical protein